MNYCDSHLHLAEIPQDEIIIFCKNHQYSCCSSSHLQEEWEHINKFKQESAKNAIHASIKQSFGIHPLMQNKDALPFLEKLLQNNAIDAVGEIGLDFYTQELRKQENQQLELWNTQLELAIQYKKCIVIHSRCSLDKIFTYSNQLKNLPAVIFHSWAGSPTEAKSFLTRGINAYFSIGKQVLNGNKRAIQSATNIPLENILLETDAPYQTLKGESTTNICNIENVYKKVFALRDDFNKNDFERFVEQIKNNFFKSYKDSH